MSNADPTVAQSYDYCRRLTRRAGSSFYPSFFLLTAEKRRAMEVLYAFLRLSDDIADEPAPVTRRRELLANWRLQLDDCARSCGDCPSFRSTKTGLSPSSSTPTLFPALADVIARYQVPTEHLAAVLDGVEMDLAGCRYETFDELSEYCHRVASAVGLACIHIWGFRGPEPLESARCCGVAFQLTNILRDLREDAAEGRIYLPLADLRACGYSADALAHGVVNDGFRRLMAMQIDRARRLYHEGAELIERLEPGGRRIFGMMLAIYHRLLEEIAREPDEVFSRRVTISGWGKLTTAARWALLPPRRSALP
jgi:15-cis-phytoene synthase